MKLPKGIPQQGLDPSTLAPAVLGFTPNVPQDLTQPPKIREKDFQQHVVDLARACGWLVFHDYDSRHSQPGFPDLVLVKNKRLLFRELKATRTGKLTPAQIQWQTALLEAGADAGVWRPPDLPLIEYELQR